MDYLVNYDRSALQDSRSEEFSNCLERVFALKTPGKTSYGYRMDVPRFLYNYVV